MLTDIQRSETNTSATWEKIFIKGHQTFSVNGQVVNILGFEVSLQFSSAAVAQKQPWIICEPIKVALFQTDFI